MRLAFLVRLNDRLRQLDEPEEITFEAARLLGEFTNADRVGYAEDGGDVRPHHGQRAAAQGRQLHAILFVHTRAARHWTPGEVALFEDVAERLRADLARARAEAELRATRTWLETAPGSMNEAVFAVDASGRFLHTNQAFLAFYRSDDASPGPRNMRELRPQALEERGLVAALQGLAAQVSGAGGPRARWTPRPWRRRTSRASCRWPRRCTA